VMRVYIWDFDEHGVGRFLGRVTWPTRGDRTTQPPATMWTPAAMSWPGKRPPKEVGSGIDPEAAGSSPQRKGAAPKGGSLGVRLPASCTRTRDTERRCRQCVRAWHPTGR